MAGDRIRVGRIPGSGWPERQWRLLLAAAIVPTVLAAAWYWLVDPSTRPFIVGTLALLGLQLWALLGIDSWVDRPRGRLRQTCTVLHWEAVWSEATMIRFQDNHQGLVSLQVRSRGRWRTVRVPVVGDDLRGPRAQPPPVLRMLARELRQRAPTDHHDVADQLDAQAAHLERGGGVASSPVWVRHRGPKMLP